MSDPMIVGSLPIGRRVDTDTGHPDNHLGVISAFPRATPDSIAAARKTLPEAPDERLDRSTDPWTDRETGERYELLRSYLDLTAPSDVVAFTSWA